MMTDAEKFVRFCGTGFGKSLLEKEAEEVEKDVKEIVDNSK